MRRVGRKGEGRFERISWDEALDLAAQPPAGGRRGARAAGDPALLVRRQHGPARQRQHGPALLPRARGEPARPDDLRERGRPRLQGHLRQDDGLRPRGGRARAADRRLGRQHRELERAPVAVRRGGAPARRAARDDRPLPLADGREVGPAHRPLSRHGRGARARDDARHLPRRPRGPRLARALQPGARGAARARARVDARADGRDHRPARGRDRGVRARVRDDAAVGDPHQLRAQPPRRRRDGGAHDRLPAGRGRRLARGGRRRPALDVGHLPGGHRGARAARPDPSRDAHAQHEPARPHPRGRRRSPRR